MSEHEHPAWWRLGVEQAHDDYSSVMRHLTKALDILYADTLLIVGIGQWYWSRTNAVIQDIHRLNVALAQLRTEVGEASPDD